MEEASGWRGFLKPTSDEVPFKITICGIEELSDHRDVGVSHVLSILDTSASQPPALGSFGEHERVELRFDDVIEDSPDHVVPCRRALIQRAPARALPHGDLSVYGGDDTDPGASAPRSVRRRDLGGGASDSQ